MNKTFIVNVGVNASHGALKSPIFLNGTFDFIPIPEKGRRVSCPQCSALPRYKDLRSYNEIDLLQLIPRGYNNLRVHNDPEFVTFTYGDYPTFSPRAANLKKASKGDFIFFLARLVKLQDKVFHEGGFFLVGFFEVDYVLKDVKTKPEASVMKLFKNNAHVRRAMFDPQFWDGFWVFKGSLRSHRFKYAIPFDREFCDAILKDSKGEKLTWSNDRSELQIIGSYTRACRVIEKQELQDAFMKMVEKKKHHWQEGLERKSGYCA